MCNIKYKKKEWKNVSEDGNALYLLSLTSFISKETSLRHVGKKPGE